MKLIRATVIFLAIGANCALDGKELTFKRLTSPPDSITEEFFDLGGLVSVKVEGEVIQKIILEFEEGKGRARVGVFYKNTTSKSLSPNYTIRFYNSYGILMGGIREPEDPKVPVGLIEPEGEASKVFFPRITRLDSLFRHADIKAYPSDFLKIRWVSISVENPKEVEQAGTGQPATRPESKSEGGDKPQLESEGRSR